jgi:UDP-N-acetylmuramyl pentapeptide phosphotransferase/UDP-N-acetylglucosamine-1-phosphate transferase
VVFQFSQVFVSRLPSPIITFPTPVIPGLCRGAGVVGALDDRFDISVKIRASFRPLLPSL